jgi:uncharacterized membrane protein YgaE (UPF0421/DUF939 family)
MEEQSPDVVGRPAWPAGAAVSLSNAIQFTLISFLAYNLAGALNFVLATGSGYIGALWAVISGIVVIQETRKNTIDTAGLRILGSLVGAIVSAVYLSLLPFSPLAMALLIGLTVMICYVLKVPGYARLAALTVSVVMVFSVANPAISPFMNAATRFFEVIIGSSVAVAVVWIWPYFTISRKREGNQEEGK